ncbi:MAG: hypothetical protein Q9160_003142 [Pyrenula sp. 1 TL-2023]
MEVAGLAVGVVGLVGLYTCCADLAQAIKGYRKFDDRVKYVKNDYDRYQNILDGWAESVGFKSLYPGTHHHASLDNEKTRQAIKNTLETTQSVLQSIDQILEKLQRRDGSLRGEKFRYVLGQETKLRNLVNDLYRLVSVLYTIIPSERSSTNLEPRFEAISNIEATIYQVEQRQRALLDFFSRGKEIEIKKWLGAYSPEQALKDRLDVRTYTTCDWAFNDPQVQAWSTLDILDSRTRLLWIYGPAGHGKSVLFARLIEQLQTSVPNRVAFYFCKWQVDETRHFLGILRSWITQIVKQVPGTIEIVFEGHEERVAISSELWDIFARLNRRAQRCIYMVDGLDECVEDENADKEGFIRKLLDALQLTRSRVLIVSRHDPAVEDTVDREAQSSSNIVSTRQLTAKDLGRDVEVHATAEVSKKMRLEHNLELKNEIVKALVDKSGGMFLWINLVMPQLARRSGRQQFVQAIEETPKDLDKAYERDLLFIQGLDAWSQDRAVSILRWVSFAMRPLRVGELVEALLVARTEESKFQEDKMPEVIDRDYVRNNLISLCGTLVEVRESAKPVSEWSIHPVHLSVKQYLTGEIKSGPLARPEKKRKLFFDQAEQHYILAQACVRYISSEDFDHAITGAGITQELVSRRPFLRYAVYGGLLHRKACSEGGQQVLSRIVFRAFDPAHSNWKLFSLRDPDLAQQLQLPTHDSRHEEDEKKFPNNPFYYASVTGQSDVVEWLLKQAKFDHADVNAVGSDGWTVLHFVARWGLKDIARMICRANSNVDITNASGVTPLHLSAQNSHLDIFNMLIESGANPHMRYVDGGTSLSLAYAAAQGGNVDILRRIRDFGIDFQNERFIHALDLGAFKPEPLHAAIYYTSLDALAWLLENGTSVSPAGGESARNRGRFALWESVARRDVDMARQLLHHGAQQSGYSHPIDKQTQLSSAVRMRDLAMVDFLCNHGVDANEANTGDHLSRPLVIACHLDFSEIVDRLLRTDSVDLTLGDRWGHTPLLQCAAHGRLASARLLLALPNIDTHVSNLDCPSRVMRGGWADERRSPLGWARHAKHWPVVKAIEERRARFG